MKKLLSFALIMGMLLMPVQAYASTDNSGDTDYDLHRISFDQIEEEIMDRNPTVRSNRDALSSLLYNFDVQEATITNATIKSLNDSKTSLQAELDDVNSQITIYEGMNQDSPIPGTFDALLDYLNNKQDILSGQIAGINSQLNDAVDLSDFNQDKSQAVGKMSLSSEMMNKLQVYTAESFYINYHKLLMQKEMQSNNRVSLQNQVKKLKLQQDMDAVTAMDVLEQEASLKDLDAGIHALSDSISSIKGELNLLFEQDFDTPLYIQGVPGISIRDLNNIDYDEDSSEALDNSYAVRLQEYTLYGKTNALERAEDAHGTGSDEYNQAFEDQDAEAIKLEQEKQKFAKAFDQAYESLMDKKDEWERAQAKLDIQTNQFNRQKLMYELGMLAKADFDGLSAAYDNQVLNVTSLKMDLFQAYQNYEWMKKGLSISGGSTNSNTGQ